MYIFNELKIELDSQKALDNIKLTHEEEMNTLEKRLSADRLAQVILLLSNYYYLFFNSLLLFRIFNYFILLIGAITSG